MDTDLKTSILINQQLPQTIREEYPLFQSFLEAYYEFLEKKDGDKKNDLISKSKSIRDLSDIDISIDEFENEFFNTYANLFPKDVSVDKEFLIKHVLPFYLSKGSEKSFKFLFRLLFNEELSLKFPKNQILKASDGKWTNDTFIRIDGEQIYSIYEGDGITKTFNLVMEVGNLTDSDDNGILDNKIENDIIVKIDDIIISTGFFVRRESKKIVFDVAPTNHSEIKIYYKNFNFNILKQRKITGVDSGASVIVDEVSKIYENRKVVYTLNVDEKTIIGKFISGERLSTDVIDINGDLIYMSLLTTSSLKDIIITNEGSSYNVGDAVRFIISNDSYVDLPYAFVSEIYENTLDSISVIDGGAGFELDGKIYALGIPDTEFSAHTIYIDKTGKETPNSFPIFTNVISDVDPANTILSSSNWNFPSFAVSNLNSSFISVSTSDYYSDIGAIGYIEIDISKTTNQNIIFNATPAKINIEPQTANTTTDTTVYIDTYGSLGKFKIINGGQNYSIGDKIIFINKPMCLGIGANAYVSNVNTASSNSITEIKFDIEPGHMKGGENYRQDRLPSVTIQSVNGSNANVIVTTIMGDGENLKGIYNGHQYGGIKTIAVIDPGSGLKTEPIIDLSLKGDGNATAVPELYKTVEISEGYWASSDGIISSADQKLQGKNYYVNYAYVTESLQDFQKYKTIFKKLLHPTGFKHYAEVVKPITVINNIDSNLSYTSITINNEPQFSWPQDQPAPDAGMKLTFNTSLNSNEAVFIPLGTSWTTEANPNVTVDWGDGNTNTYTTKGNKSHQYASAGTYHVTITGSMPEFGDQDYNDTMTSLVSVDYWDDSLGLTVLAAAFYGCTNLTSVPINLPSTVTDISWAFDSCSAFNSSNLSSWNTANVTNMAGLFSDCTSFNQPLNSWNTANVTRMDYMFNGATAFNLPLNNWDVSNVTDMNHMFADATAFSRPINTWNVGSVLYMFSMFAGATAFNQPLIDWNVSNVVNMQSMFENAYAFNRPIGSWNTANVQYMSYMFKGAHTFNRPIGSWNVGSVLFMAGMFQNAYAFNQSLNSWNVGNVQSMANMFDNASVFNNPLNSWNTGAVTDMSHMFDHASVFNQPINSWNTGAVTDMSHMFDSAMAFNQPLNSWNVGSVTNMESMFYNASTFNQSIDNWNVSNVTNMQSMFSFAALFNQPLNSWNVGSVTNMQSMFYVSIFNQPLNNWNTGSATDMSHMFDAAFSFNQPLDNWNVSNVTNMQSMFYNANSFNQDISNWCVTLISTEPSNFSNMVIFSPSNKPVWGTCPSAIGTGIMQLTFNTSLNGNAAVFVPLGTGGSASNPSVSVNWGDGYTNTYLTKGNKVHQYASAGTYQVTITGTMPEFGDQTISAYMTSLVSVDSWDNNLGLTNLSYAFRSCTNLTSVPTNLPSTVTNLSGIFYSSSINSANITSWNTVNVTDMRYMFYNTPFNQPIDSWNVSNVTRMDELFNGAASFNQSLNSWNVGSVTNMNSMFQGATIFNQPLDNWDVSVVTDMNYMFYNASAFNQNISNWCVTLIPTEPTNFSNIALSPSNKPVWGTCPANEVGQLWSWGSNLSGQIGDNTTTDRSSPVQTVTGGTNWKSISGGYYKTVAIKADGTLWVWGRNNFGQLADNTTTNKSSPVQTVTFGTDWKLVSGGAYHTAAIKTDGTLWLWGKNDYGQLGDNTGTYRSSPIQTVAYGTTWKSVDAGFQNAAAIKTDGTLWLWGRNTFGQLGNNSTTDRSSPVQTITFGTNWKSVSFGRSHAAAIKTDGTLWLWGYNNYGQLGDNTGGAGTHKSSPVQTISFGTNWKSVSSGENHTAAIKTDGTLWLWGYNLYGQLGDNTDTRRSSPVQVVGFSTNWKSVSSGKSHTAAVKTDGTLWTWGFNGSGQLGNNTTTGKSSPVQTITYATNWKSVSSSAFHTVAIR